MNVEPRRFVLDSFALLAYLQRETGMQRIKAVLHAAKDDDCQVYLSWINLGEVLYIVERGLGVWRARETLALVQSLPIDMLDATSQRVLQAAHIKANYALAYADAFAVAAAIEEKAVILTGAPEYRTVERLVQVEWM